MPSLEGFGLNAGTLKGRQTYQEGVTRMHINYRAMLAYLVAIAIGTAAILAFWELWAIPELLEVAEILEGVE